MDELIKGIPNPKVGITTRNAIENLGGKAISTPTYGNPYHGTLSGLTAQQASKLFTVLNNLAQTLSDFAKSLK